MNECKITVVTALSYTTCKLTVLLVLELLGREQCNNYIRIFLCIYHSLLLLTSEVKHSAEA